MIGKQRSLVVIEVLYFLINQACDFLRVPAVVKITVTLVFFNLSIESSNSKILDLDMDLNKEQKILLLLAKSFNYAGIELFHFDGA